jgi:hypothetical protein
MRQLASRVDPPQRDQLPRLAAIDGASVEDLDGDVVLVLYPFLPTLTSHQTAHSPPARFARRHAGETRR